MKLNKRSILRYLFLILICLSPALLHAQGPDDPGYIPPNPCTDPDDPCPIDGGVVALLAAGVGYGIKKVHDSRKKSVEPQ